MIVETQPLFPLSVSTLGISARVPLRKASMLFAVIFLERLTRAQARRSCCWVHTFDYGMQPLNI